MAKIIPYGEFCLYLVEMGVGHGRANNLDDVTLVQYFLNLWFSHPKNAGARAGAGIPLNNVLKVDGLIGPKTKGRIKAFQGAMKAKGRSLIADGCIDRMKDEEWIFSDYTGSVFAIFHINVEIMDLYEENLMNLFMRPDFPRRLEPMLIKYATSI